MKTQDEYEHAALISKSKGLQGEIVVVPPDGLPLRLYEGLDVWIVPPTLEGVRKTRVTELRMQARGSIVRLEGVESIDGARPLVGRYLLAQVDDFANVLMPSLDPDSFEAIARHCVGCLVQDEEHGIIGMVERVEKNPAHPLLVVSFYSQAERGKKYDSDECDTDTQEKPREVLIPYIDEFIVGQSENMIETRLPQGLIELNQ